MKEKKGISLIVLIITIVVIVILATAIIVSLAQTNVIENANEAKVKQDFKTLQSELNLYIADRFADTRGSFKVTDLAYIDENSTPSINDVLPSLRRTKYKDDVVIINGKIAFKEGMNEQIKEWATQAINSANAIQILPEEPEKTGYPQITVGTKVTEENSTVTGNNPAYNNPVIPVGFKAKETADATWADTNTDGIPDGWNNGLVISDDNENEFVWVPVDGTNVTYEKNFTYSSHYGATSSNTFDVPSSEMPSFPTGYTENTQITEYEGFYIGRYEAGTPDGTTATRTNSTGIPQSKGGRTVWTNLSYANANASAKLFCNTDYVKSGLMTGTSWDTVCNWINNSEKSVTDSRTWGNYNNSSSTARVPGWNGSKKSTGYSDYWKAQNIYDFAGNVNEYTNEKYSTCHNYRGGAYSVSGLEKPASHRTAFSDGFGSNDIGFRIQLYIM